MHSMTASTTRSSVIQDFRRPIGKWSRTEWWPVHFSQFGQLVHPSSQIFRYSLARHWNVWYLSPNLLHHLSQMAFCCWKRWSFKTSLTMFVFKYCIAASYQYSRQPSSKTNVMNKRTDKFAKKQPDKANTSWVSLIHISVQMHLFALPAICRSPHPVLHWMTCLK